MVGVSIQPGILCVPYLLLMVGALALSSLLPGYPASSRSLSQVGEILPMYPHPNLCQYMVSME